MKLKGPLNCPWARCSLFSALLSLPPPTFCHISGWLSHEFPLPSWSPVGTAPFRGLCGTPAKAETWDGKAFGQDFPYRGKRRGFLPLGGPGTTPQWQFHREVVMILWTVGGSVELEVCELPAVVGGRCQARAGGAGRMLWEAPAAHAALCQGGGALLCFHSSSSCAA